MGLRDLKTQATKMAVQAGHSQASNAKDKGFKAGKMVILRWLQTWMLPIRLVVRGIQLIFALTVIGLYGTKVHSDSEAGRDQDLQWSFAVGVGSVAAVASVLLAILAIPQFKTHRVFALDFTIAILYIATFGTFAVIFLRIPEDDEHKTHKGASVSTMRHAVWIDLVNAIFWALTGSWGCFFTFAGNKVKEVTDRGFNKLTNKAYKMSGVDSFTDLESGHNTNFDPEMMKDFDPRKIKELSPKEMRDRAKNVFVPTVAGLVKAKAARLPAERVR